MNRKGLVTLHHWVPNLSHGLPKAFYVLSKEGNMIPGDASPET